MSDPSQQPKAGFAQFDLDPSLLKGIQNAGFTEPRPIQAGALPPGLEGRDILGLAQTGTGKTAGFAIPILERIARDPGVGPRALILAPTRELAAQITAEFRTLAQCMRLKIVTIYGGVGQRPQVSGLKSKPDVIVACPGRLLDLMQQGFAKLGTIETLVLDEADHMFDMGFLITIRKIIDKLPRKRQNLLFSATMPKEIRHLADEMLNEPHIIELAHNKPTDLIEQLIYPVHRKQKIKLLDHLLMHDNVERAIIFTRTKRGAKQLAQKLNRTPHRVMALQGNMSQSAREKVMQGFRSGKIDVLVATDIAARGIDVAAVTHVINYDAPDTAEAYTHRIGRTGRAECTGKSCTFITNDDRDLVKAVERKLKRQIEQVILDDFIMFEGEDVRKLAPRPPKVKKGRSGGGGGSRRPSRAGVGAAANDSRRSAKKRPARTARAGEDKPKRPTQRAKARSGSSSPANPWGNAKPQGQKSKSTRQDDSQSARKSPSSKPKRQSEPNRAPAAKPSKPAKPKAPARKPRKPFKAPKSSEGGNRAPRRRGNPNKASSAAAHY